MRFCGVYLQLSAEQGFLIEKDIWEYSCGIADGCTPIFCEAASIALYVETAIRSCGE